MKDDSLESLVTEEISEKSRLDSQLDGDGSPDSKSSDSRVFYSSLVVEHIVAKSRGTDFQRWIGGLEAVAKRQMGFVRMDHSPPLDCEDEVTKYYTIVHFDTPGHLNGWVESDARDRIFESGQDIFRAYRFKSFTTGLEGWFSRGVEGAEQSGLGPPAWKQILSVVFGLYPLVMLRIKLFPGTGLIGDWSPSGAMLIATLVTSSVLAVVVMPMISRLMSFWLYPSYFDAHHFDAQPSDNRWTNHKWKVDVLGCAVMGLGLIFMVSIFDRI
ncbi:MAG: hypothetical protein WBG63_09490 [Phormidesmis sp.]